MIVGDWIVAGNAARRMIRDRLASTAQSAAEGVPFFLETGQNLLAQMAKNPSLLDESGDALSESLATQMHTVTYFDQLFMLDGQGELLAAYPVDDGSSFGLAQEERTAVTLAGEGVLMQRYGLSPAAGEGAARMAFLAAILDEDGNTERILLGRTRLLLNPFFQPLHQNLEGLNSLGGEGKLLDEQGRVLYSSNPDELMSVYTGRRGPVL